MISEGSCDTEDWRNYAENSALIAEIKKLLKKNIYFFVLNYIKIGNQY